MRGWGGVGEGVEKFLNCRFHQKLKLTSFTMIAHKLDVTVAHGVLDRPLPPAQTQKQMIHRWEAPVPKTPKLPNFKIIGITGNSKEIIGKSKFFSVFFDND